MSSLLVMSGEMFGRKIIWDDESIFHMTSMYRCCGKMVLIDEHDSSWWQLADNGDIFIRGDEGGPLYEHVIRIANLNK
jgi:hypothetical protein